MRQALVVFIFCALVLKGLKPLWESLHTNIILIETVQIISQRNQDSLRQLYQIHHLSDEFISDITSVVDDGFSSDGTISARVILDTLAGGYQDVDNVTASQPEKCLRRPACRLLAGKANYILGNDEAVVSYWSEPSLWRVLVGNNAERPLNQADLVPLDRYYSILRDIYPDNPDAYFMLGSIRRSLGKWEDSLPYFEHAVTLDSERSRYLCALGEALTVTKSDMARGQALCHEALALDPDDMWLYIGAGRALGMSGACEEAHDLFIFAVERFPDRTEPQTWLDDFRTGRIGFCITSESN